MTEELKKYEKSISTKYSFGFTPNYTEEIETNLKSNKVIVAIAIKTFELLEWDLVYQDENSTEAKRSRKGKTWTEKISVKVDHNTITVKSISLGSEMLDLGRNSKRVKLFIYAFNTVLETYDQESLNELEKQIKIEENWDDYKIPTELPSPKKITEPKFWIPILGGVTTALIVGFLIALLSIKLIYLIGLFEVVVATILGFMIGQLIKAGNFTEYKKLNSLLIGLIILIYVSNQYFQLKIIASESDLPPINFLDFILFKFNEGLTIDSVNTGWIGLVISWLFQIWFTWAIAHNRMVSNLTIFQLKRVPPEVTDFTCYNLIIGKTESQVKEELSKMGWVDSQCQKEVFEAIDAMHNATELSRI